MIDVATMVRTAREQAHMSARDLATASGVSPSTVTRIEHGEINPTIAMLERLLRASGNQLEVGVSPRAVRPTLEGLRTLRDAIIEAAASFGASNVRVFCSVSRGDARDDSDVDLLIDVPAGTGLITLERIAEAIEHTLPWPVDVMTSGAARGRMAHVLDEAVAL
jgi:transcriptional regulator with XRE-family HTH domain